jgi:plasmid replication initiation protein
MGDCFKMIDQYDTRTKYKNGFNSVNIRKWTAIQTDFLFGVMTIIKETGERKVQFSQEELKALMDYKAKDNKRWFDLVNETTKMMLDLKYTCFDNSTQDLDHFNIFERSRLNLNSGKLVIELTKTGFDLLNSLDNGGFTVFDFKEYTTLSSGFSKTLFRHLKQWRTIGKKEFSKDFLFEIFDLSPSMRESKNFNQFVLKPIKAELPEVFVGFNVEPVKVGRNVISYIFTWQAEKTSILLPSGDLKAGVPAIDTVKAQLERGEEPKTTAKSHKGRPAKQKAVRVETKPEWLGKEQPKFTTGTKTMGELQEIYAVDPSTLTPEEIKMVKLHTEVTSA